MSLSATARYRLQPAPQELVFVQELLNTRGISRHGIDLLSDVADAQPWIDVTAGEWSSARGFAAPAMPLSETDLAGLRTLRTTFDRLFTGAVTSEEPPAAPLASTRLILDSGGAVRLEPTGRGWRWFASALWTDVLSAQHNDTFKRLKFCRNPVCHSAFYDYSKNNSGVWHNVKTCGNAANLRTYRARKKTGEAIG